jgi:hypothetical protein
MAQSRLSGRARGAQPGNQNAAGPHGHIKVTHPGGALPKGGMLTKFFRYLQPKRNQSGNVTIVGPRGRNRAGDKKFLDIVGGAYKSARKWDQ